MIFRMDAKIEIPAKPNTKYDFLKKNDCSNATG
jgi:hypothetical protein